MVFLAVVASVLALYGASDRPLFTAHEARAARCARHMLRPDEWPGDRPNPWLIPQFSPDVPPGLAYQKPPLYYWAVAAASLVGGEVTPLTVRLPSAVGFVLLVLVVYFLGRDLVGHRTGLVAALVLASTPKVLWWGRAAILDPMLAVCIAAALLCFVRAHLGRGGAWQYWLFWALAGLGTLVKATALVVPLLTVGLYLLVRCRQDGFWRSLARLKPITGPLVLLAVAAPWHMAAHWATGGAFSRIYWGMHVFGRATGTGVFEARTAPWFYLPAMARDLFPWVVFLPGALVQVWRRRSRPERRAMLFPFVWFVGSLAFFSAVSFRKDEYMLVAYGAAALLVGYLLDYYVEAQNEDAALRKWIVVAFVVLAAVAVVMVAALLALGLAPWARQGLLEALDNRTDRAVVSAVGNLLAGRVWLAVALAAPVAVGAVASLVLVLRRRATGAFALTVCTTILAFALFVEMAVPALGRVRGLVAFADAVEAEAVRRGPSTRVLLAIEECHELAFLLDERADELKALVKPQAFLGRETAEGRSWLVVTDRDAYESGAWADLGAWQVVAQTPEGHRRPMICLAPPAEKSEPTEEP
ncbi:MAG: glycosyltransferase family 39 protein [Planctomycetes bacterium]|nr:glycosyltransferase family 39 protein [Planctomycetota bacterium]